MTLSRTLPEAIQDWKNGNIVWSVDLGGMGPGYEQAIQILLWELLAQWEGGKPTHEEGEDETQYPQKFKDFVHKVVDGLDEKLGFSGAQVGAARNTAWQFLVYGYDNMMNKLPDDRWIQVRKNFPSLN